VSDRTTHLISREEGVLLAVNYSVDRRSHLHNRYRQPMSHRAPRRRPRTKSPCRWGTCFISLIIPATLDRTRRVACYSNTWLMKAKQADVLVAGIAAPLPLLMIAGTLVAKHSVKLVSLSVKSVAFGASCDNFRLKPHGFVPMLLFCMTVPGRLYTNSIYSFIYQTNSHV
jgi:hypothetical protein